MECYNTINQEGDKERATQSRSVNRSFSMHSTSMHEITKKTLLQSYDRNGSIKNLAISTVGSTSLGTTFFKGKVKKLCSIFDKKSSKSVTLSTLSITENAPGPTRLSSAFEGKYLAGAEGKIVIYFTSLRGIRRTFIDCGCVLMIMRGFRIELDERDVSMHLAYRKELENVFSGSISILPQVFIKGTYIGGAELIRQLHETGELAKMVRGIPVRRTMKACEKCGDIRFVPCLNCSGSKKVFDEEEQRVNRCPDCNENGLIQCNICNLS